MDIGDIVQSMSEFWRFFFLMRLLLAPITSLVFSSLGYHGTLQTMGAILAGAPPTSRSTPLEAQDQEKRYASWAWVVPIAFSSNFDGGATPLDLQEPFLRYYLHQTGGTHINSVEWELILP